jgi:Tfp pilus assembly protein PilN
MIIRSNLASVPIKNYSLFLLSCVLLGIAVVAFTAWNLMSLSGSYSKTSELNNTIANQQIRLRELESKANELQTQIGNIKTPEFVSETEFMNNAIKRRTFSWTALFDHFEEVLPPTVKMISVFPSVTEENIAINLEMAGQSLTDMLELVRLLERDPAFANVVLKGERTGNDEQINFSVSLTYIPLKKEDNEKGESL